MKRLGNRKLRHQVRTSHHARQVDELAGTGGVDTARGSPARHLSMAACYPAKLARGLSLAALMSVSAVAAEEKALEPYIVNGLNTQQHPSTAALLYNSGGNATYATQICTATLIGCETVLTAGHCVDSGAAQNYSVYFQHAGVFDVSSITPHPDYMLPFADVAVLKLATPVTGITPSPINAINPLPFIPYPGEIVGFGLTAFPGGDNGIKRYGSVSTADCASRSIIVAADFETPNLDGATSVAFPEYVDDDTHIRFTAVADNVNDEVIGLVTNQATSACVNPADTDQKLGTGIDSSPGSVGRSGFAIRADFPGSLPRGGTFSAQFQTLAGVPLRLRLFDESGKEVGATQAVAGPASGTCGMAGDARARTTVAVTALASTSYAILDLAQVTSGYVFVIDDVSLSINFNNTDHICWQYEDPVGLPGQDSDTCKGDSGGPLFMDFGAGDAVAGVTSLGFGPDALCMPGGMSVDTNVFAYNKFILQGLGTDATAACGGLVPVGGDGVVVTPQSGTLDSSNTTENFDVTVTDEVDIVRVTLNAEDGSDFDVDLFVKQGPGVSATDFDCKVEGKGVFGACELDASAAADWSVLVSRVAGEGEYQVTATAFPTVDLPPGLSCQDSCGGSAGNCWCDEFCMQYGDCCEDYQPICVSSGNPEPSPNSCQGNCGGSAGTCWCDEACTQYGDCCSDYQPICLTGAAQTQLGILTQ